LYVAIVFLLSALLFTPVGLGWAEAEQPMMDKALEDFLRRVDPAVSIRQDALVTLSNGAQFVLVLPPELEAVEELGIREVITAQGSDGDETAGKDTDVGTDNENKAAEAGAKRQEKLLESEEAFKRGDVIVLNDGRYFLRIISLPNGRSSSPVLEDIPLELRRGLLPQQFKFPEGFLIPTAWKSLTGNLLAVDVSSMDRGYPLALFSEDYQNLYLWDIAKNRIGRSFSLHCKPADILPSSDGHILFVGCQSEPTLYVYSLQTGSILPMALPYAVGSLRLDAENKKLYISHPEAPELSRIDLATTRYEGITRLKKPADKFVISPYRKRMYAASGAWQPPRTEESPKNFWVRFFRMPPENKNQKILEEYSNTLPVIQVVGMKKGAVKLEKNITTMGQIVDLYVQDEKVLWIVGSDGKNFHLVGFDLRWEEFTPYMPLEEQPLGLASDDRWLYLLSPHMRRILRLDLKTQEWGPPIALDPVAVPLDMEMDPIEHQAYVLSADPPGIQVVNLLRGDWVGTQLMDFKGSGPMAWLVPEWALPDRQARIKFQDARLLHRIGQKLQAEKSPSDPRARKKSRNRKEPQEKRSTPEAE